MTGPWWLRRIRRAAAGRDCCYHHGINWHLVSETAVGIALQAQASGTSPEEAYGALDLSACGVAHLRVPVRKPPGTTAPNSSGASATPTTATCAYTPTHPTTSPPATSKTSDQPDRVRPKRSRITAGHRHICWKFLQCYWGAQRQAPPDKGTRCPEHAPARSVVVIVGGCPGRTAGGMPALRGWEGRKGVVAGHVDALTARDHTKLQSSRRATLHLAVASGVPGRFGTRAESVLIPIGYRSRPILASWPQGRVARFLSAAQLTM